MEERYDPKKIEPKWQEEWERSNLNLTRDDRDRPKFYLLEMFPYPSGDGLSVGHLHNYVPCDVLGRYKRRVGFNVLHAMGWDAFGLPAENDALLKGLHPKVTVPRNAGNFKRQLKMVGCAYDWTREINSSEPGYYKWTQWFFLLMYKRGLAYRAMGSQWWCDKCRTILANEQVVNGCCWRHPDTQVSKRDLEQWFLKITAYADRLLEDLDQIDWPEPIKLMQRNWIGRSEGAELAFPVVGHAGKEVRFFTTRPDTVFGVSFMVLAPEHPLVAEITSPAHHAAVEEYVAQALRQSEIERLSTVKEKTGVFTGSYARNLFSGKDVPIWIADYVLMSYGTGAIMGAPGEDQRDYEFAKKYGLEVPVVTAPADGRAAPADCAFRDAVIAECAIRGRCSAVGWRGYDRDFESVLLREFVVALVLAGRSHDCAGPIAHQHVVGDPDRHVLAREQVARVRAGEDSGLFLDRREPFDLALAPRLRDVLLDRRVMRGRGYLRDQRMLRREHHERHAEDRVGPRREKPYFLARMPNDRERQFCALRTSDPVALHQLDRLGPVDLIEVFEQPVGVSRYLEEPLLEVALRDLRIRMAPAAAVDHLLIGENRAALVAPPLRSHRAIREPALVHQQEEPLRPLVVAGLRRIDLARPVVGASDHLQLTLEVSRIARNRHLGMESLEQRVVFRRQPEGVPAHRMQYVEARPPLVAAEHVARHVIVQMPDRKAVARRIREHLEQVELGTIAVVARQIEIRPLPFLLPLGLDFLGVVAFFHRLRDSLSG